MGSLRSIRAEYLLEEAEIRHQKNWHYVPIDIVTCSHDFWLEESGMLSSNAEGSDFIDWSYFVAWMHTYEYYPGSVYPHLWQITQGTINLIADLCRHDRHLPLRHGNYLYDFFSKTKKVIPPLRHQRRLL
jgi:hypothetical protein